MKKYVLIIICSLLVNEGSAQKVWEADLPVVEKSDYYNIELSQEMIGAGLKYLKIFDGTENEVPYFIRPADPIQEINNFEAFELKSNSTKDSLNIIVIDNQKTENLNRFCVVLQKADAQKYAFIRGCNDLKQWYIVKQQTEVSRLGQYSSENAEMLILDFPQGDYRYYEITLWSDQSSPLEVHKVGKIKNSSIYGNFVKINTGKFLQENDNMEKATYLHYPEIYYTYCVNKVEFFIKNKPDYYRQAVLYDSISYNREHLILSSRKENLFYMDDFFFTPQTIITIENQQNPPLVVDSINMYGLCRYACIYLEEGKKYHLYLNTAEEVSNTYDIEYFRDEIPIDLPTLQLINRQYSIPIKKSDIPRELSLIEKPVFLWSVILIVGIFLLYLCIRMINEMKKRP
ncbi:MAG: hypothetical protein LBV72_14260 [Tannerella sp.]|jgi:hypothetical protein|nr:hypothetical protein [Tannerella sp.]